MMMNFKINPDLSIIEPLVKLSNKPVLVIAVNGLVEGIKDAV